VTLLEGVVGAPRSLLELATSLGRACLGDAALLHENLKNPVLHETVEELATLVRARGAQAWLQQPPPGGYVALLDTPKVHATLAELQSLDPASHLGILRGLLAPALDRFFDDLRGPITLARGMPIPNATRRVQDLFGKTCTPYQQTITARELLGRTGFDLFHDSDPRIGVTIDFSHSDKLDALTWPKRKLPRVATVHPRLDGKRLDFKVSGDRVFDVKPEPWSLQGTLAQLTAVASAHIAMLPELCLPSAGALAAALASTPSRYSPIVVAGSAHERINAGGKRSSINESRVYIDGQQVLSHKKIRPLETKHLGNDTFEQMLHEDLSPTQDSITLLSGEKTRMAVMICADINDSAIVRVLEECGVNLLLVPSLTYKTGAFNGAVCQLASHCQALCVVANPILDRLKGARRAPFLVLAAVPRAGANEQSQEYFRPRTRTAARAMLDPNRPLAAALSWI
jgi:predicted amidohydrolase